MGKNNLYALYKGDEFIDLGTIDYLAKILNVHTRTIRFYSTPTYQKRNNYKGWVVIKIIKGDEQ